MQLAKTLTSTMALVLLSMNYALRLRLYLFVFTARPEYTWLTSHYPWNNSFATLPPKQTQYKDPKGLAGKAKKKKNKQTTPPGHFVEKDDAWFRDRPGAGTDYELCHASRYQRRLYEPVSIFFIQDYKLIFSNLENYNTLSRFKNFCQEWQDLTWYNLQRIKREYHSAIQDWKHTT